MNLFHKMKFRRCALLWNFLGRIANNAIVIFDDIFFALGKFEHSEKAMPNFQKQNEYQVINAHKGSLA